MDTLRFLTMLLGVTLLPSLWGGASPAPSPSEPPRPSAKILEGVPLVRQATDYSCGASALQAVLAYYGVELREDEIVKAVGTDSEVGTLIEKMAEFAVRKGLRAVVKSDLSLGDLDRSLERGHPILVELQAWPEGGKPKRPYPETWEEGHYAVVVGVNSESVYFVDPSLLGSRGFIPVREFLGRWHNLSSKDTRQWHTGILFEGSPKPPPPWQPIE